MTEEQRRLLASIPKSELLAELVRRENQPPQEQVHPWCDDCAHYKTFDGAGDPPAKFNPCSKKHKPHFWTPRPWESPETFGYYLAVCEDRKPVHEQVRESAMPPHRIR